jgi:hypothetical protein
VRRKDNSVSHNPIIISNKERMLINGLKFFDYLVIQSVDEKFSILDCYSKHKSDILITSNNQTINASDNQEIKFKITNEQDNRLFYEARLIINCSISNEFFSNFLDPGASENASFTINCDQGVHKALINFIFVDELKRQHEVNQELIINAQ